MGWRLSKADSSTVCLGFRNYVQTLGIDMPCDDIVSHGPVALATPVKSMA